MIIFITASGHSTGIFSSVLLSALKKKIKEKSQEGTRQKITPAGVKGRVKGKGVGEAWLFSLAGRKIASSSRCTGFLSRFIFMSSGKQHKFSDC